jgi:hypothetical protein
MTSFQTASPDLATAPQRVRPHPREAVLLLIDGILDLPAAHRLAAAARRKAAEGGVWIDVRRARVHDAALAALASEVDDRIELIGLSRHHERLLRYLEGADGEAHGAGP